MLYTYTNRHAGAPKPQYCNQGKFILDIKRAVLMGTKSCTKILNFSTRFSCENLAVEDFVTLLMRKKSC